jgi:hypothetical protein
VWLTLPIINSRYSFTLKKPAEFQVWMTRAGTFLKFMRTNMYSTTSAAKVLPGTLELKLMKLCMGLLETHIYDKLISRCGTPGNSAKKNLKKHINLLQILRSEHRTMVGKLIRDQINDLDRIWKHQWEISNEGEAAEDQTVTLPNVAETADNVGLGSKLPPISFDELEQAMKADTAFHRLRIRFTEFFTNFLHTYEKLPDGKRVNFHSSDKVRL